MTFTLSSVRQAHSLAGMRGAATCLILFGLCVVAGCKEEEAIRHYQVPREEEQKRAPKGAGPMIDAPVMGEAERIVGAYLLEGDKPYIFFKLTGDSMAIERVKADFQQFLEKSVDLKKSYDQWGPLPKGWEFDPAVRQMREATFLIKDPPLTVTVSKALGSELDNVNRWRGQVGLPKIPDASVLPKLTQDQKIGGQTGKLVDLKRPQSEKPGTPTWNQPPGWEKRPAVEFSIASFKISANDQEAFVTVSPMAHFDPVANYKRWRTQQLGLPQATAEDVKKDLTDLEVDGTTIPVVDLTGTKGPTKQRMVVALVPQGDTTWVIKMMGTPEAVAEQKTAFNGFVKSFKINAAVGDK